MLYREADTGTTEARQAVGVWVSRGQTSTKTMDGRKLTRKIRFTLTAVLLVI